MESSSVSQKLRCSEFTLELSRALVVSEGDTSTLESDSPFWEAHVACAGEMDAGSILVTRGSEIVQSPVMAHEEWFIGQPWGSGNFKGREGFAQQVERTFPYCL